MSNLTKDEIQAILSAEDMMINYWPEPADYDQQGYPQEIMIDYFNKKGR